MLAWRVIVRRSAGLGGDEQFIFSCRGTLWLKGKLAANSTSSRLALFIDGLFTASFFC